MMVGPGWARLRWTALSVLRRCVLCLRLVNGLCARIFIADDAWIVHSIRYKWYLLWICENMKCKTNSHSFEGSSRSPFWLPCKQDRTSADQKNCKLSKQNSRRWLLSKTDMIAEDSKWKKTKWGEDTEIDRKGSITFTKNVYLFLLASQISEKWSEAIPYLGRSRSVPYISFFASSNNHRDRCTAAHIDELETDMGDWKKRNTGSMCVY